MDEQSAIGGFGRLWAPWLIAAAAWVLHLLGSYLLVELWCRHPALLSQGSLRLLLHGITLICVLAALAAAALAWRELKRLGSPGGGRPGLSRRRFLDRGGLAFGVYMAALVLLEGWGNFVLEPCQ